MRISRPDPGVHVAHDEDSVVVRGLVSFANVHLVHEALRRVRRPVTLDLRPALLPGFVGAALIRDARSGRLGPIAEVLIEPGASRLMQLSLAG